MATVKKRDMPEPSEQKQVTMQGTYKSFLVLLRIYGMMYIPKTEQGVGQTQYIYKGRLLEISSKIWHTMMLITIWMSFIIQFVTYFHYKEFDVYFMNMAVMQGFTFFYAISVVICPRLSRNWFRIFAKWEAYRNKHDESVEAIYRSQKRHRIILLVIFIICISSLIFDVIIESLSGKGNHTLMSVYLDPYGQGNNTVFRYALCIFGSVVGPDFYLPYSLIICFALSITDEFKYFNNQFKAAVQDASSPLWNHRINLEIYRQWHEEIIDILNSIDDQISPLVLALFVIGIPINCGYVYTLVFSSLDKLGIVSLGISLYLIIMDLFIVGVIYAGTKLNVQATQSKRLLYSLDLSETSISPQNALQYTTFLTRLSEGHIGITGCKLFHIDKMTIKVVVLMTVSYTLILLKFGSAS